LLVRERTETIVREVREEMGYECLPVKQAALYDRDHPRHGHPPLPYHVYKIFFLCELVGGQASPSIETSDVGLCPQDDLPAPSLGRVTPDQINWLFEHHANPDLPTDFD
jgi:ADP-ribose pyrophosphatase YjhB (NUDIX family)